jgi:ketosteroid isomerase-like protein
MSGYYQSDSLRFAVGGSVTYGWQLVLERYKNRYKDKAAMGTLTFSDIDIKILSKDVALVFGKWKLKRAEDEPWGLFTLVFKKTGQGWRVIHDHTSTVAEN